MRGHEMLKTIEHLNPGYIEAAAEKPKPKKTDWRKWVAMAACLCLVLTGVILFKEPPASDFLSMLATVGEYTVNTSFGGGIVNSTQKTTTVNIDGKFAWYKQESLFDSSQLERYVGKKYLAEEARTLYYPTGLSNLKYLIQEDSDGALTLLSFLGLGTDGDETLTYGDILSIICGVDSPDDIVSITTSPIRDNNTDEGMAAQKKVGTHTYTSREDIEAFYEVVWDVGYYFSPNLHKGDINRFTYSFSADSHKSTYGSRCIKIQFADGSTHNAWMYNALSGIFYNDGGPFSYPLSDEDVFTLNDIFGIK